MIRFPIPRELPTPTVFDSRFCPGSHYLSIVFIVVVVFIGALFFWIYVFASLHLHFLTSLYLESVQTAKMGRFFLS